MRIKKGSKLIAAAVTFSCLVAVVWLSCTKASSNANTCVGMVCLNGSFCHVSTATHKASCVCPSGYEGPNCATVSAAKYLGNWHMIEVINGSDSSSFQHDTLRYSASITQSATPTTFFINNFADNPYYNEIICTLDSSNTYTFVLDTISAYHLLYDHYHMLYGYGYISPDQSFIRMDLATRHLSPTSNWINDTMTFFMSR